VSPCSGLRVASDKGVKLRAPNSSWKWVSASGSVPFPRCRWCGEERILCVGRQWNETTVHLILKVHAVHGVMFFPPSLVAVWSKARFYGRLLAGIAGSNPAGAWMSVSCECCVLSARGFRVGLITGPEESYRECVCVRVSLSTIRYNNNHLHLPWVGKKVKTKKVKKEGKKERKGFLIFLIRHYVKLVQVQWSKTNSRQ